MTIQDKPKPPIYHEFEFSFCGFSGSGKTTLIEKLIRDMSSRYSIGFVKSDAHIFEMDRRGKDTQRMWSAGADGVYIFDKIHNAHIQKGNIGFLREKQFFYEKDFVIVEGRKSSPIPKALVLDEELKIFQQYKDLKLDQVQAFVGPWEKPPIPLGGKPYFYRDNIQAIGAFVLNYFEAKAKTKPLFGLVLSGGKSQRMKTDKALLYYGGKHQVKRAYELLGEYCDKVFHSIRRDQENREDLNSSEIIYDRFLDFGPIGGILSALYQFNDASWLVLACDLPLLKRESLDYLMSQRDFFKSATAFKSSHDGLPEPLCAIYESRSRELFMSFLGQGYKCPRKVLINSNSNLIHPVDPRSLDNVNYPEEYLQVKKQIERQESQL